LFGDVNDVASPSLDWSVVGGVQQLQRLPAAGWQALWLP
jgi:hypothetical protein